MRRVFTTASVALSDRLDYWTDVVATVLWPCRMSADPNGYRASLSQETYGSLRTATIAASGHTVSRIPGGHDERVDEQLSVGLVLSGSGVIAQDGRECRLGGGEATLFDPARPYTMSFRDSFSFAVLNVPRALVRSVGNDTRRATARALRPVTPVARSALSYLDCVLNLTDGGSRAKTMLANGTPAIIDALLTDAGSETPGDRRDDLTYQRAIGYIDMHLSDPDLGPSDVASACHVSRRQLYRIFDTEGETVSEAIRDRRLARAQSLLETLPAETPVSWVGARVGFGSAEHFTRAFRAAYGLPPAAWRASH